MSTGSPGTLLWTTPSTKPLRTRQQTTMYWTAATTTPSVTSRVCNETIQGRRNVCGKFCLSMSLAYDCGNQIYPFCQLVTEIGPKQTRRQRTSSLVGRCCKLNRNVHLLHRHHELLVVWEVASLTMSSVGTSHVVVRRTSLTTIFPCRHAIARYPCTFGRLARGGVRIVRWRQSFQLIQGIWFKEIG